MQASLSEEPRCFGGSMPRTVVTPAQARLAAALAQMKRLQDTGRSVFRSSEFDRPHREALLHNGFLQVVVKGWYMAAVPGEMPGDTTPWMAAMREFIAGYCEERFGEAWHLSPEYSLHLHAGATALPRQAIVHSPAATNGKLDLPGGHSILYYRPPSSFPDASQIERIQGLRLLTAPAALAAASPTFFTQQATDAQVVLRTLRDASEVNRVLLEGGHSHVTGRLAGALRAVGREDLANDVRDTLRAAGYVVIENNPFATQPPVLLQSRTPSPYVLRLQLMWAAMREEVLRRFPPPPAEAVNAGAYLADVQEAYKADAYHSLSIEGYRVTAELIERVASGEWSPETHAGDRNARDALAAHGYWRAFQSVALSVASVLAGKNAGSISRSDHGTWYREIFAPSVEAGIIQAKDLAGYRNLPVYIRNAEHVPPPATAARELMPALFDLLADEPDAGVRAVLGHFCFVFIHPYMDGNGRVGRFLMNTMLASGGYPWTVIRVERREGYMRALDAASARQDIAPFADFVASSLAERSGRR